MSKKISPTGCTLDQKPPQSIGLERIEVDPTSSPCINFASQYSFVSFLPEFCVHKFGPVSPKFWKAEEIRGTFANLQNSGIFREIVLLIVLLSTSWKKTSTKFNLQYGDLYYLMIFSFKFS